MKPSARKRARCSSPAMELAYAFGFDAAHRFRGMPHGHRYASVHGHSFRVEVAVRGVPQPPLDFVTDFARLEKACLVLRNRLDHTLLNEVEGLGAPSLERLCVWIWQRLAGKFPGLSRVTVRRDSLGQSCTYRGPGRPGEEDR